MKHYSEAAVERMMKVQEVILRAIAGKLRWWEAAECRARNPITQHETRTKFRNCVSAGSNGHSQLGSLC
jgi:hypothetical protein